MVLSIGGVLDCGYDYLALVVFDTLAAPKIKYVAATAATPSNMANIVLSGCGWEVQALGGFFHTTKKVGCA